MDENLRVSTDANPTDQTGHELLHRCYQDAMDHPAWEELERRINEMEKRKQRVKGNKTFKNMEEVILRQGRRIRALEDQLEKLKG